jgi:DNA-binding MarR family transcriptional regulator
VVSVGRYKSLSIKGKWAFKGLGRYLVATINTDSGSWRGSMRVALGAVLLDSPGPRTAAELAGALGKHPSNVKKTADDMVKDDLLVARKPVSGHAGRGRRAESAYELASAERPKLEAVLEEFEQPTALRAGQQLVFASIPGGNALDLMGAAIAPGAASRMSWAAFVDGEPQECVIAFDGANATSQAADLMAALEAAQVHSRRATVAQVSQGRRFLRDAARTSRLASRAPTE